MARSPAPAPEVQTFLEEEVSGPPTWSLSIEGIRSRIDALFTDTWQPPVASVMEVEIPGPGGPIPLRVYVPAGVGPFRVLLYCHGGGWIGGGLRTHDSLCRALCRETDGIVVAIDYRLAPAHPFPAAINDVRAVLAWTEEVGPDLQFDPDRIAIGGDSAGGTIAAATAHWLAARGASPITHQLLMYPPLDCSVDTPSYSNYHDGYLLTRRAMVRYWDAYLERPIDRWHPFACPLKTHSVEGLPPTTMVTCGFDPLRSDGEAYVSTLTAAGVPTTHLELTI